MHTQNAHTQTSTSKELFFILDVELDTWHRVCEGERLPEHVGVYVCVYVCVFVFT